ncbi:hypothetical protein [Comamonas sp.]
MSSENTSSTCSKVQLTLMHLFRLSGQGAQAHITPFVGTQKAWLEEGQAHLLAGSVPFHDRHMDVLSPQQGKGMLALFGIRDALSELQHWRTIARNSHAQFTYVHMQVDVGSAHTGVVTRALLREKQAGLRFINAKRCSAEMQKEWLARFAQWVREEGGDVTQDMAHVRQMAKRPDLYERLLWEDEDLRWIDVMVLPLADWPDSTQTRQVAYVRAGAPLLQLVQGSDQVQVHLPDWMQKK